MAGSDERLARPLNATAASLLGFLHEGSMTGWDLVATAQQRIGRFWSLTRSQVYRELTAMSEAGLITAGDPGPRDRRPYTITDAGRAAFTDWVHEEPGPESIRFPLLLLIRLGQHIPPERLAAAVRQHRAAHAERLAEYERVHDQPMDPYAKATLDFGIGYERAVLEWFDNLPTQIRGED